MIEGEGRCKCSLPTTLHLPNLRYLVILKIVMQLAEAILEILSRLLAVPYFA